MGLIKTLRSYAGPRLEKKLDMIGSWILVKTIFASVTSSNLRNHEKTHTGENNINVVNATLHLWRKIIQMQLM